MTKIILLTSIAAMTIILGVLGIQEQEVFADDELLEGTVTKNTLSVQSGDRLIIAENAVVTVSGTIYNLGGEVIIRGTLILEEGPNIRNNGIIYNEGGIIINHGEIQNNPTDDYEIGTITNLLGGIIHNQDNAKIINEGIITIKGDNFENNNNRSKIINEGVIDNNAKGTINNNDHGRIENTNDGRIDNLGKINNNSGTIISDDKIGNLGELHNYSYIQLDSNSVFTNRGTLTNDGTFYNFGIIENRNHAVIDNNNVLRNDGTINNLNGGDFDNFGNPPLNKESTLINKGGTLNNDGDINIGSDGFILNDSGIINNNQFGIIKNLNMGTIINKGGTIDNNNDIDNFSEIINKCDGVLINVPTSGNAVIEERCVGDLTASVVGFISDGTLVEITSTPPISGKIMNINVEFVDSKDVNYDLRVTQDGSIILDDLGKYSKDGLRSHRTELSSSGPVDITVTFQGYGVDDPKTGPIGEEVVFSNVVPEFGTIVMMILAVAIISIVAVTAKSRVVPRF